ncbi:DUF4136 domain-containing protein [Pusillimonas sp. SM2304]|uniref:DUF4136 domain-containing protein n=1 Tax=Pusillimonas sp. SM2304 TaxID=3073241 RepID=UPI002875FAC5|nr:DUF4136 domain-containing protein [Pusillimonas sp. SM2304]MDS1142043.1 DUF4136 domain-containing protein [Pusillimonas sp. SM2304]
MRHTFHQYQRSMGRLMAVAAGAFLVAGCASTLSARVTSYQQWPANAQGESYRIVQAAGQENNLEFQNVADMIRASIGQTGLVEAQPGSTARFNLHISYDNPVTKTWVQRYNDPYLNDGWMGPAFGGYYGGFRGWGGGIYMSPSVSNFPVDIYKNTLTVIINDNRNNNAEVYRSSAVNASSGDNLMQAMPYLARAVFDRFPGNNGQTREVEFERRR